ncbi:hypothetical protein H312_01985 [Anncaliia algerae PRA339]|uniref:Uncharacterized protein n=1 Tax=Anncaliia algerae PRA339 TaxID=1288291 RepID=A0A059F0D6_9MICR|nr:hypothetical protein H312_01985 [Anncaliia algerae PRA339]
MDDIKKIINYINNETVSSEDFYILKNSLSELEAKYLGNNLFTILNHLEGKEKDCIDVYQEENLILSIKEPIRSKIDLRENEFRSNLISKAEFLDELRENLNQREINIKKSKSRISKEEISYCKFNDFKTFYGDLIEANYVSNYFHCLYCYLTCKELNYVDDSEDIFIFNGIHTLLGEVIFDKEIFDITNLLQKFVEQNKFIYLEENFNKFLYTKENLTKLHEILELRYFLAKENDISLDLVMTDTQVLNVLESKSVLKLDRISSVVRSNFADFSYLFKNDAKDEDTEESNLIPPPDNILDVDIENTIPQEEATKLTFSTVNRTKKKKKKKKKNKSNEKEANIEKPKDTIIRDKVRKEKKKKVRDAGSKGSGRYFNDEKNTKKELKKRLAESNEKGIVNSNKSENSTKTQNKKELSSRELLKNSNASKDIKEAKNVKTIKKNHDSGNNSSLDKPNQRDQKKKDISKNTSSNKEQQNSTAKYKKITGKFNDKNSQSKNEISNNTKETNLQKVLNNKKKKEEKNSKGNQSNKKIVNLNDSFNTSKQIIESKEKNINENDVDKIKKKIKKIKIQKK